MQFLNLSSDDYANMSHENANALRSIGVHCDDFAMYNHPFGYTTQSKLIKLEDISELAKNYDVVQIFHSDERIYKQVHKHPKVVVYHTGTRYRQNPSYYNNVFKDCINLTDQCEFIPLGNMRYIAPHTILSGVPKRQDGKLIVGHYPSNADVKGTDTILTMLEPFFNDFDIRIDTTKVTHQEQLKRMAECHVYIELFANEQQGKPYGCHGVTAFESAALGCFTVTQNIHPEVYHREYGACYFHLANDKDSFIRTFEELKNADRNLLTTPSGFYFNHNIESAGYKILELTR